MIITSTLPDLPSTSFCCSYLNSTRLYPVFYTFLSLFFQNWLYSDYHLLKSYLAHNTPKCDSFWVWWFLLSFLNDFLYFLRFLQWVYVIFFLIFINRTIKLINSTSPSGDISGVFVSFLKPSFILSSGSSSLIS